jgi:hypothetical protein
MEILGGWCYKQGRYDEAEALLHKALEIRREVLGREHPVTLRNMELPTTSRFVPWKLPH